MKRTLAIIIKDSILLIRETGSLLLLFILPAIFIITLSVALQGAFSSAKESKYKFEILLVNHDKGRAADNIIKTLGDSKKFKLTDNINNQPLSREIAIERLKKRKNKAAIIIPAGATDACAHKTKREVEILVDPGPGNEYAEIITSTVQNSVYITVIESILGEKADLPGGEGLLVKKNYIHSEGPVETPDSVQQNVPGWTIFALFWIAQTIALNILSERLSGAYKRVMASPITRAEYIIGKTIPFALINMIQAIFLFMVGIFILPLLGCPKIIINNLSGLIIMTIAVSFSAISLGLLFASITDTLFSAATLSVAILIVMTILGGIMVPRFIMPEFMQKLGLFVPQAWALEGYLNIIVRGSKTAEILPHASILSGFGLIFISCSVIISKIKRNY